MSKERKINGVLREINQWGFKRRRMCRERVAAFSKLMNSVEKSAFWGWFFMIFGSVFFSGFFFAAVISKLIPPSDNAFISAIQNDRYYCFLLPLTIPVIVIAVYCHWLSMKLFKHA